MRTSHLMIRKRILEVKSSITDEQFFASREYSGFLTDIAESATKRYNRTVRVTVKADHDDETVAFTDFTGIMINACNEITWSFPSRPLRSLSLQGLNAHEFGHMLFTDNPVWHSFFRRLERGRFYPRLPDGLNADQMQYADEIREALLDENDPVPRSVILNTAHALSNILEDGYVQNGLYCRMADFRTGGIHECLLRTDCFPGCGSTPGHSRRHGMPAPGGAFPPVIKKGPELPVLFSSVPECRLQLQHPHRG